MVNFTENNLSANISASTLDRKAMLETSSESSEHFRHVGYDGPALLPVSITKYQYIYLTVNQTTKQNLINTLLSLPRT